MIAIDNPDDARISGYHAIRERDLVGREGRFIAEGEVVLRALSTCSTCIAESVLIDPKRADKLAPILSALPPQTPIYAAAQPVLDAIAGFHLHRGILAIGRRRDEPSGADLLATATPGAVVLMLFGIANHDNMGGLFRTAAALGGQRPAIILSPRSCDPLYRKSLRVSIGHALHVPYTIATDWPRSLDAIAPAGFTTIAMTPAGSVDVRELSARAARPAIVLGTEGRGLSDDAMSRCALRARITMHNNVDSLNVVIAGAIALHALV